MCKPQEQGRNTHTHVPVPGLRQKPLDPAVTSGWALRFSRAPHTGHLPGKEQPPAPLLTLTRSSAGQPQHALLCRPKATGKPPCLTGGLGCSAITAVFACHSWQLLPACGAPAHGAGQSTAGLPGRWRSPGCPGQWQHPAWGCWGERLRPSSSPTNPSPASSHPVLAGGDFHSSAVVFFHLQSPGLFKARGPTAGCMEGVEGNVLELGSGLCCGQGGTTRRGPKSCPVPQKFGSNSPGSWEIQLPTGQIPLGWSAQRAGHCSLLLASSSWYWWKLTLSPASHVVSNSAAVWAGEAPQAGALRVAGRLGKPLRLCQPSGAASPQHSCQSSFPRLGCFAIYSPGNVSASQRVAKLFLPLVVNLHAGRQGVAENRTGSRGCA